MKKFSFLFLMLLLGTLLNGCLVVSLHPLGNRNQRSFDPSLLGTWRADSSLYRFTSLGDTTYDFRIIDQSRSFRFYDSMAFEASLFRVGDHDFLDLLPADEDQRAQRLLENYLPVHTFLRVDREGEQIVLRSFDNERLQTLFRQNRIRLRHEEVDEVTVITAASGDIYRFIRKYADDPEAYEENPDRLTRIP